LPREWAPSDELFRSRLHYSIEARGVVAVARQQGRTVRTVRAWQAGQLPSQRIRRSVSRTGRTHTGPVVQPVVGEPGIIDRNVIRLREELNRRRPRQRRRAMVQATTEAEREVAEAMPTAVDDDLIRALDEQRRDMLLREAQGEEGGPGTELYEDWAEWREMLNAAYGRQ
jgi:small ligand-binding sensory domain FIST